MVLFTEHDRNELVSGVTLIERILNQRLIRVGYSHRFVTLLYMGLALVMAALALVLGGAVGNLIDRAFLGYVTDFIRVDFDIRFFDPFPSFNVADSSITVGAVLLIIDSLFFSGKQETP